MALNVPQGPRRGAEQRRVVRINPGPSLFHCQVSAPAPILVCFAVKQEEQPFKERSRSNPKIQTLLTGMGMANASKTLENALLRTKPHLLLSCGFAGGLNPELAPGTVLFAVDPETRLQQPLLSAGARPGRFHCLDEIATTIAEKTMLWQRTGADAVEMESQIICRLARARRIPCGTVRVVLDAAGEELPLDFNRFMNDQKQLRFGKLAGFLLRSPSKVIALMRLQRDSARAATKLAQTLIEALEKCPADAAPGAA